MRMLEVLVQGWALGVALALAFGALMLWARSREKAAFNGGDCPDCGTPWRHFDNDSQGGRGYTCDTCPRGVWVSYPGIDGAPKRPLTGAA